MTKPSDDEFRDYLEAARQGDLRIVRRFVQEHPDLIDARPWFTDTTALKEAAAYGRRDMIEFLLDAGADIDKSDAVNQTTPLMHAAMADKDCMILLLDRGADLELQNSIGQTALGIMASLGRDEAVTLLLNRGADVHAGTGRGFTPLRMAVYHGYPKTAEMLLQRGAAADIDIKDGLDMTPLMWAAHRGSSEMARLLLGFGAKADIRNFEGDTAADIAADRNHPEVAALIQTGVAPRKMPAPVKDPVPANDDRSAVLERLKRHAHEKKLKIRPPKP